MVEIDIKYLPHVINDTINDYLGSSEITINAKENGGEIIFPFMYCVFWAKHSEHFEVKNLKFFSNPEKALLYATNYQVQNCYTYIIPIKNSTICFDGYEPIFFSN